MGKDRPFAGAQAARCHVDHDAVHRLSGRQALEHFPYVGGFRLLDVESSHAAFLATGVRIPFQRASALSVTESELAVVSDAAVASVVVGLHPGFTTAVNLVLGDDQVRVPAEPTAAAGGVDILLRRPDLSAGLLQALDVLRTQGRVAPEP